MQKTKGHVSMTRTGTRNKLQPYIPKQNNPNKELTAVFLVAAILAVRVPVAAPLSVNAFPRAALHLTGRTLRWRRWVSTAALRRLVRLVLAVHVVVAQPALGNAGVVPTGDFTGAAGGRSAVLFVAAIPAVILTVTDEITRHAAATGTGELQRGASNVA